LCSIAGWDPTGGAGAQADLETFAAHGAAGVAVLTASTVQGREGVVEVHPLPGGHVERALRAIRAQRSPAGFKVGMLATGEIAEAVARALAGDDGPRVVDPVLGAGAGGTLTEAQALPALWRLAAGARIVTPNLPEAARLLGVETIDSTDQGEAARLLRDRLGCEGVLLKGGHGEGGTVVDVLAHPGGLSRWSHPRIAGGPFHGTGCTLASAALVALARGRDVVEAAGSAIGYVQAALEAAASRGLWCLPRPPGALSPRMPDR
jgi:hydroxymethylpyrimidine/phosphomethylpyrimidine kinase